MHDLLNLKLFLFLGIRVGGGVGCHLRHVEDFEHGKEVEVFHVETFKYDLSDNEISVLLFKLYFSKELKEGLLCDGALSIPFGSECC
jgi:hypothetical protein